jgi:phosphoribosylglycinamide formyltransferase-1
MQFAPRSPLRLVVLISGGGTTLRNLIEKIAARQLDARTELVISSNPNARGLQFAREAKIPAATIERVGFESIEAFSSAIFAACRAVSPDLIVMGGFLKLIVIPPDFENRILNIHPALVPAFCGKGFYGPRVHEAVLEYGAKVSGCTVHFVDNHYDHGPILLQRAVPVLDDDTAESLAERVFQAERKAYPEALQLIGQGRVRIDGRRVRITP